SSDLGNPILRIVLTHLKRASVYKNFSIMSKGKNQQVLNLQVTDGLAVAVIQNPNYEFLMPTKDVSLGYGISTGTIRKHQERHQDEFIEGKHFVKGATISHTLSNIQPHAVFWTKAGIVRLGFFIKSERAKLFRDWAENVILEVTSPKAVLPPVKKRKHNRLSQARLVEILADVALIEDKELRLRLVNKLMPEQEVKPTQLRLNLAKGGNA